MAKLRKKKILFIDDSPSFLKSMNLALNKIGFECQIALNLDEARDLINTHEFDLIVCDYFMPDYDGMTALDCLAQYHKKCPLVLTSAYPLDIDFKKSDRFVFVDKLGLLDWLSKKHAVMEYA
jgi:CheY-like chemotaxis protein